jgi:Restriction endonuclease
MDLDSALKQFDTVDANLRRLEEVWGELSDLTPSGGPSFTDGSDPESRRYRELQRAYEAILKGLPAIGDYRITTIPWDLNAIGQARLDALELGEFAAKLSVEEDIYAPAREIEEYQAKLSQKRRELVRAELNRLVAEIDGMLLRLGEIGLEDKPTDDPEWAALNESIRQVDRLVGRDPAVRRARWGDLLRHLRFGERHDLEDIIQLDWPAVRQEIDKSLYSEHEPLPVEVDDLAALVATKPGGPVATKLNWGVLNEEDFERLLYNILLDANDYANPQWLTQTNAPDRGRDISVERISSDSLSGPRRQRVIIQAKHYQRRSVRPVDVREALTQAELWQSPRFDVVVIATSGRFTTDAIQWIEQHNEAGKRPEIVMWPESHLEGLLAERPHLIAEFKLR